MSLVHIDVLNLYSSDIDRLHERPRAHIMQVSVNPARREEGRVCESIRAGGGSESYPGPRSEMPARRIALMYRDRAEQLICPFLSLV